MYSRNRAPRAQSFLSGLSEVPRQGHHCPLTLVAVVPLFERLSLADVGVTLTMLAIPLASLAAVVYWIRRLDR